MLLRLLPAALLLLPAAAMPAAQDGDYNPPQGPEKKPEPKTTCNTICADFINDCGKMFGGCFPDPTCTGGTAWPTFTPPPCTATTPDHKPTPKPPGKESPKKGPKKMDPKKADPKKMEPKGACTETICYDFVNECSKMYGGCTLAPKCGGPMTPTFSKPPCPTPPPTKKNKGKKVIVTVTKMVTTTETEKCKYTAKHPLADHPGYP